ncbi:MAG: caspase family protein [Cyanobacteria bacterium J06635_15]
MKKVALLIAVSKYQSGFQPLAAAVEDVQAMKEALRHERIAGFDIADIQTLVNPDPQKMREEIAILFTNRAKDDLLVLYFSGHGFTDDRGNFYLTTPSTKRDLPQATSISASYIHSLMEDSRSKQQVVVLDCCFSGAFSKGMTAKGETTNIERQLGGQGRAVLTSSSSTEYSFEQKESDLSVYTHYLIEGLKTGAADLDGDGVISVDELHDYTRQKVQEAAPAMDPKIYLAEQGYKILLAKAPTNDPYLEYRRAVEKYARQGDISFVARNILNERLQRLSLDREVAENIEKQVLQPYREYKEKVRKYEHVVNEQIRRSKLVTESTYEEIKNFQRVLGLRDKDVISVEALLNKRLVEHVPEGSSFKKTWLNRNPIKLFAISVGFFSFLLIGNLIFSEFQRRRYPPPSLVQESSQNYLNYLRSKSTSIHNMGSGFIDSFARDSYDEGRAFYATRDFESAIQKFKQAVELNPNNSSIYELLGKSYYHAAQHENAVNAFDTAIRLNHSAVHEVYQFKALSLKSLGQYQEAIAAYEKSLNSEHPEPWKINTEIGIIYYENLQNLEQSFRFCQEATQSGSYPRAHECLGSLYESWGNIAQAQQSYRIAKELYDREPNLEASQRLESKLGQMIQPVF